MTNYLMDTSALAKRYVNEIGSKWMLQIAHPASGNVIIISALTTIEMASAINRTMLIGKLSASTGITLLNSFLLDVDKQYLALAINERVQQFARSMIQQHGLRILDATQLATAIEASQYLGEPMTFVSADNRLLAAAAAEGFAVDNPNSHP